MINNNFGIYNSLSLEKEISEWIDASSKIDFDLTYFNDYHNVRLLYNKFLKMYCFKFVADLKNLITNNNTWRKIASFQDVVFSDEFQNNECFALEPNLTSYNKIILNIKQDGIYYKRAMSSSNWYEITNNLFITSK